MKGVLFCKHVVVHQLKMLFNLAYTRITKKIKVFPLSIQNTCWPGGGTIGHMQNNLESKFFSGRNRNAVKQKSVGNSTIVHFSHHKQG